MTAPPQGPTESDERQIDQVTARCVHGADASLDAQFVVFGTGGRQFREMRTSHDMPIAAAGA
jgi:hypothetical protein